MASKNQIKEKLTPIVLEILEDNCPWIFLGEDKQYENTAAHQDEHMFQAGKLYSTKELAEKIGITVKTLHNRMNAKRTGKDEDSVFEGLPSRIIGRTRVYEGKDLQEWWDRIKEY